MTTDQKRIMFFWIGISVAYVLPILVLSFRYDLFKSYVEFGTKLSTWVILLILFLLLKLWGEFRKYIDGMNEGVLREVLLTLLEVGPYLLILGTAFLVDYFAEDFVFVAKLISFCFLGSVPFTSLHRHYDRKRRIARGDVRVLR